MIRDGLISRDDLGGRSFPADHVDYAAVGPFKLGLVRRAWENFRGGRATHLKSAFDQFVDDKRDWLGDYARFMAIRRPRRRTVVDWPAELRRRDAGKSVTGDATAAYQFGQPLLPSVARLRRHAHEKGVRSSATYRSSSP